METIAKFLAAQPVLALFLVISTGYAIGQINIKGFSLGVGAVLFSGLAVGAISPASQPPPIMGTLGLILFLYGIGVMYGKQFFAGLGTATGLRYNLLMIVSILAATGVTIAVMLVSRVPATMAAGLYAGTTTTAAALLAAVEASKSNDPAIGYSVAFPVGLFGTMLGMYFMQMFLKPKSVDSAGKQMNTLETEVAASDVVGMTVAELSERLPAGVSIMALRSGERNQIPRMEHVLQPSDVLFLGSEDPTSLDEACAIIGHHAHGRITADRMHLDYLRVFVSKPHVIGSSISELKFPDGVEASVVQVRRADTDLVPTAGLTLEYGDRVGVFGDRKHFEAIRKFFGDSIRSTTEFSYVALGIGMVLGVIASIIPIPVPGLGTLKVGIAGGVLLVALVLGKLGRSGPINWTIPYSANVILRNFGVSLFLAQIGMSSGQKFVATVQQTGVDLLLLGAMILIPLVLVPFVIGHFLMRMPFDDLLGVTAGLAGNAAIATFATKAYPSDRVEISYAMVYPGAIILKILAVQALIVVWG